MKRFIIIFVLGFFLGAWTLWYYKQHHPDSRIDAAGERVENAARKAGQAIEDTIHSLKLNNGDITNELARTGKVIREKAQFAGQAIADATADARITAAIKGKLIADSGLASLKISVNTTDGVVTLSGTVSSPDQISRAIAVAMEVDGVTKVISTLQIKPG